MTPDNWMECPFCVKPIKEKILKIQKRIEEEYNEMTAKEYDEFKPQALKEIAVLEKSIEEEAYLRIDGIREYDFDSEGNLVTYISAHCDNCNRTWRSKDGTKIEPTIGGRY